MYTCIHRCGGCSEGPLSFCFCRICKAIEKENPVVVGDSICGSGGMWWLIFQQIETPLVVGDHDIYPVCSHGFENGYRLI